MRFSATGTDAMTELAALLERHLDAIPMVRAMQVRVGDIGAATVRLHAPLGPNLNDKGCAFGGSLVALMMLAGWSLVEARLQSAGHAADVFVADSQVDYLAPLWDDLAADATAADGEDWDEFLGVFAARGRARIAIAASVPLPAGGMATRMRARYVAIARR